MASSNVVEIIHNLTFNLTGKGLDDAIRKLKEQAQGIDELKKKEAELTRLISQGNKLNVNEMQRLSNERAKTRRLIEQETQALQQNFTANKQLQTALTQEIGIIQRLENQLKDLQTARRAATSQADIDRYNKQISGVQSQLSGVVSGGRLGQIGGSILSGLGFGAGFGLVTQGIQEIRQFVSEASQLARETEGVQIAFERLNRPDLLQNLRDATRGTVSDLNLMKQAVNFENFGLPVEKLAEAFEFARQRARDTGQSVDYLVNSITTGIARKSPLILDNLGINAKTVRDRFKETGDFAEAAFQIIAEESAKAGQGLDTFSDKQERLNANVENFKVRVGGIWNFIVGEWATGAENVIAVFQALNSRFVNDQQETQSISINSTEEYFKQYQDANKQGRQVIESQALASYNALLSQQKQFEAMGLQSTADALAAQALLYTDFFTKIRQKNVSFRNFTQTDLLGMSREELQELRKSGDDELGLLNAGDTKGIAAVTTRIRQIDDALGRFTVKIKTHREKVKKENIRPRDIMELSPQEQQKELKELADFIDKIEKETKTFKTNLGGDTGATQGPSGLSSPDSAADILRSFGTEELDKKKRAQQKKQEQEDKDERIKNINAVVDAYQTAAYSIAQALNTIYEAQARSLDNEIRIRQERVTAATEIAERGNAELLNIERKRLEEAQQDRERIARRQIAVNAALQVSNSLVAVARAASESASPYASIALIAAIIGALGAGYAAAQSLSSDTTPSFKDGVVGFKGKGGKRDDKNMVRISNGESVINAASTEKHRALLERINAGLPVNVPVMNIPYMQSGNGKTSDMKRLESKFDKLIAISEQSGVNVSQHLNERGFTQRVERNVRNTTNRFKR